LRREIYKIALDQLFSNSAIHLQPNCMTSLSCPPPTTQVHQGACVTLAAGNELYQVIGIDDHHDRCWLRRWPLSRQGSEVFEISLHQVQAVSSNRH
jgi:hypothetical protein